MAEWLNIDWRALLKSQSAIISSKKLDPTAAPELGSAEAHPFFDHPTDTWLRTILEFYPHVMASLYLYAEDELV